MHGFNCRDQADGQQGLLVPDPPLEQIVQQKIEEIKTGMGEAVSQGEQTPSGGKVFDPVLAAPPTRFQMTIGSKVVRTSVGQDSGASCNPPQLGRVESTRPTGNLDLDNWFDLDLSVATNPPQEDVPPMGSEAEAELLGI